MAKRSLPCPTVLRQLLRYEPDTGKLFWRTRKPWMFADAGHAAYHNCAKWNARFASQEALTALNRQGYRCGSLCGTNVKAHRVAWVLAYGEHPKDQIDHVDGDRENNTLANLRDVSNKENSRSAARPVNNTSGHTGVAYVEHRGKYRAYIKVDGRYVHLGYWNTLHAALSAYEDAKRQHGFGARHGQALS